MPNVTFIMTDGRSREIEIAETLSIMEGALAGGIDEILAECGGSAMCGTCHVYVEGGPIDALPAMGPDEDAMLQETAAARASNSRLSCQIHMAPDLEGLVLRLPVKT